MSDNKFLHTIVAPNLTDSNFGQSIQTQFNNINTNFQRLVSAAYLSGQDGNDVVINDIPIYSDVITVIDRDTNTVNTHDTIDVINEFLNVDDINYNFVIADGQENKYEFLYDILQQAVFTDFGLQLVKTIFDEHTFVLEHHILTYDVDGVESEIDLGYVLMNEDLERLFPSYSDTNKYPVWIAFAYSPFVRMFAIHDIDTDTITNICATQLYYFYDARIGSIQLLDDKYTADNFTDYTSFIAISSNKNADGNYEINGTYTMFKSQDLPTLYYDNDAQEFCWKMNGIETNITAQGVKGDKGDPAGCWFCRGKATTQTIGNDPMINVTLISYYTTDELGNLILRNVSDVDCEIENGDFVCVDVYNSDETNNTTYFDTIFGNVNVYTQTTGDSSQLVYNVTRPYYTSVMSMINNSPTALYEYLKRISGNGLNDALHGLFVPSYSSQQSVVHMMNSAVIDDNETLIIHPVSQQNVNGSLNGENIPTSNSSQEKPNFIIDGYGSVDLKSSDLITDGDVKCNDMECENINSNGSITANVNGISNVKIGIPVGTVIDYYGNEIPEGWMQIDDSENNDYGNINSYIELTKVSSSDDYDIIVKLNASNNYFKFTDERLINLYKVLCEEINDNVVDSGAFSQTTFENATNKQLQVFFLWPFDVITRIGSTVFRLFLRNYKTTSNSTNPSIQIPTQNGSSVEQQRPSVNQPSFT